ncbi:MAG: YraN family protein [Geminicoccaceae bacterium]
MSRDIESRRRSERAGRRAETIAAWILRLKAYSVLHRRYATPFGEIDIIARRGQLLVFVEVKRRRQLADALHSLDRRQCDRIARAAQAFIKRYPATEQLDLRFDLMAIAGFRHAHVEDAFRPSSC